jgi:hypothetical protein
MSDEHSLLKVKFAVVVAQATGLVGRDHRIQGAESSTHSLQGTYNNGEVY